MMLIFWNFITEVVRFICNKKQFTQTINLEVYVHNFNQHFVGTEIIKFREFIQEEIDYFHENFVRQFEI